MNLIAIFQEFQTQEQALEYLERIRWRGQPWCPYCHSEKVGRHASGDRAEQRWQCQDCHRAFAVTVGTIFHRTHIPLKNWFLVIGLMLNAKKSASAYQIARDIGMRRPTVWSMMHRIRVVMANDADQSALLHGIVEADETYVGGKPRKGNRRGDDKPNLRGRGTKKTPVLGVIERGGRVRARPAKKGEVSTKGIAEFISENVDIAGSLLITDELHAYRFAGSRMNHAAINHQVAYADGHVHTNSIEGFWSLVKRAWYGQHHHYSRKYMPLYISEACYKFNNRGNANVWDGMIASMVGA
jgi:transposase-like protein